jgi:hypothetical protein
MRIHNNASITDLLEIKGFLVIFNPIRVIERIQFAS